jgi:hypothetical protein
MNRCWTRIQTAQSNGRPSTRSMTRFLPISQPNYFRPMMVTDCAWPPLSGAELLLQPEVLVAQDLASGRLFRCCKHICRNRALFMSSITGSTAAPEVYAFIRRVAYAREQEA